jgi:uncharacterized integral membrane protein
VPDEFDIDVEALAGETEESHPATEATAQSAAESARQPAPRTPRVLSAHKAGPLQKFTNKVKEPLGRIKLPEWNLRTFLQLLGLILVLWFLLENWPPARVKVLIWDFDAPKTVLFLFNVILGALLLRGWQIFLTQRAARRAEAEAAAKAAPAEGE